MKDYLKLIRTKHWIKNLLIFIPIICANAITYDNVIQTILGFFSFSFGASFIYIVNDIRDIEKDKLHPKKKDRPLPSGKISKTNAIILAIVMLILSIGVNIYINKNILNPSIYILLTYIIINILYSFGLKNIAIIDVILLATGFILRVYYGALILDINVSSWLFLTILNASLFMGLGKRKKELILNKDVRKVLEEYNEEFLDKFQYVTLTLTLVFYSLWTIEQKVEYLVFTIPLIIIIFMKYCLIIEKSNEGDPTTILYQDKMLLSLCAIYGITMIILLTVL